MNKHYTPHHQRLLRFDGNTAHSSGYHWYRGSCIYFGGLIWWEENQLHYNSGRYCRDPRLVVLGKSLEASLQVCQEVKTGFSLLTLPFLLLVLRNQVWVCWNRDEDGNNAFDEITNTKVFLCNRGVNHWGSRVQITNYEVTKNSWLTLLAMNPEELR